MAQKQVSWGFDKSVTIAGRRGKRPQRTRELLGLDEGHGAVCFNQFYASDLLPTSIAASFR